MNSTQRNFQGRFGSQQNPEDRQGVPPQQVYQWQERPYPEQFPAPIHPAKLPLMRPQDGRMVCGVCKGISLHLGIKVGWVRIVALLLALTIVGAIPYVFLWLTLPSGDPVAAAMAPPQSQSPLSRGNTPPNPGQHPEEKQHTVLGRLFGNTSKPKLIAGLGIILLLLALFMLIGNVRPAVVIPALLFLTGIGLSWIQTGDSGLRIPLLLTSLGLILASVITFLLSTLPLNRALTMMSMAAILLLGITAVAVPWIGSLIHQLSRESALKEREEERADMTAHLHDGVLQTLALIQLHADNPQTVFTLARSQERDLRNWLYQDRTPSERSVGTGIRDIAAEIEDSFGRPIEVVTVGDAMPCAQTDALLDASRQALVNAVTHGGEPISVYCEAGHSKVELFVRDHGSGFDMDKVPPDRLGIRQSIMGRIKRQGGTVEIVSRPGWGTEVRMRMPLSTASQQAGKQ